MLVELKLNEAQISKITQSDGLSLIEELHMLSDFGKAMGKKKHVKMVITDLAIPLAKEVLSGLVSSKASNPASNAINKFERRINRKGAIRARKGFT